MKVQDLFDQLQGEDAEMEVVVQTPEGQFWTLMPDLLFDYAGLRVLVAVEGRLNP
jgi:hypothetical protein